MPRRAFVAKELASIFGILSHPDRVRIIAELGSGERDVNSLQASLGVSHSRVSQHLAGLRAHRMVAERRDGRRVFYHLVQPALAVWLLDGLKFLEGELQMNEQIRQAVDEVRSIWSESSHTTPSDHVDTPAPVEPVSR
jgi:DNA-binding transcriptional ArsR family regulator